MPQRPPNGGASCVSGVALHMPAISRFHGIVVTMYYSEEDPPHFHARHGECRIKIDIDTGIIDVAMHRDDIGTRPELPVVRASKLPVPLEERTVIIVDDVLYTGRTARAAMDAINSFGRPARIQLAALIDRGHRELPIRADYVGKNLPTTANEKVRVQIGSTNEPDGVWLIKE